VFISELWAGVSHDYLWCDEMQYVWQALQSGSWLTLERARGYSLILLTIAALAVIGWIAISDGLVDRNGKPIGTDFSSFYAAGKLALEGKASDAYNLVTHYSREQQLFGAHTPYFAWLYPPNFFLVAAPLAMLPYPFALALWQGSTLALYLAVIAAILYRPRPKYRAIAVSWLPVAAAFPAVFINLGHGQNGFLSAALFGGALILLPRLPISAGILIGLLSYKPQLGLVVPFALLAAGQWRVIIAATITAITLAGASFFLFGGETWWSFLASTETSRTLLLEKGAVGFEKLQSAFAAVRMWGGSITLAYVIQAIVSVTTISCTAWVWHSDQHRDVKAALLLVATTLASPHVLDYDLVLLAPAIAFFVAARLDTHFKNYEISLLAAIWIVPLFARATAGAISVPIGFLASLIFFVMALRRTNEPRGDRAGTCAHA
jgi:alpha-1,2-mannosyltransferase